MLSPNPISVSTPSAPAGDVPDAPTTPHAIPAAVRPAPLPSRLADSSAAPALAWAASAVAIFAAAQLATTAAALAAGVAATLSLMFSGPRPYRAASAAAAVLLLLPAAVAWNGASAGALALSGLLVAGASFRARPVVLRHYDPQRHLEWARRRQERAHVLVMRCADEDRLHTRLLDAFRVTDSVTIVARDGRCEVQAVIDDHKLSRTGLERRLLALTAADAELGWAVFPEDGVTLPVLVESARRASEAIGEIRAVRPLRRQRVGAAELQTEPT